MTYKIEKNIPIPPKFSHRMSRAKMIKLLEIGDSVLLKTAGGIYLDALNAGIEIVSRKEGKKVRIWRIK